MGAFKMHQDFAFFPHTNTDLLAVMVMLDAAAPEMDACRWCPAAISGTLESYREWCVRGKLCGRGPLGRSIYPRANHAKGGWNQYPPLPVPAWLS
ncbi:MAG TPA: hypothetical protein DIU35_03750 [Candidatus Latescibacteria bacterium]|nr:hypothetical protein [Candidatus Latescibacterota bacterium]